MSIKEAKKKLVKNITVATIIIVLVVLVTMGLALTVPAAVSAENKVVDIKSNGKWNDSDWIINNVTGTYLYWDSNLQVQIGYASYPMFKMSISDDALKAKIGVSSLYTRNGSSIIFLADDVDIYDPNEPNGVRIGLGMIFKAAQQDSWYIYPQPVIPEATTRDQIIAKLLLISA